MVMLLQHMMMPVLRFLFYGNEWFYDSLTKTEKKICVRHFIINGSRLFYHIILMVDRNAEHTVRWWPIPNH